MGIFIIIIALILLIGGVVGCFLPILPGPPLTYFGLLLLHFTKQTFFSTTELIVWFILVLFLQIIDYITPIIGNKYSGGTTYGSRGCLVGTILGLFFMPWGIILGPFLGAIIGELIGGNKIQFAIKSGIGSLIGFILGTLLKLFTCLYFLYQGISSLI